MDVDVQRRIRRFFGLVILLFLALVGWQSYWHLVKSDWLLAQQSNRRLARAERHTPRGTIYDRAGARLAWTENGVRRYKDPIVTAAVLGYLDPVYGRTGVEGEWDNELAGLTRTTDSREVRRILRSEKSQGKDLALTLDFALQAMARKALGTRRGAVVMLDPATGGILALATNPTFNPLRIATDFPALTANDTGDLRNRAVQDLYPPGSTMKVVTTAAALMHGIAPDTRYTCPGTSRVFGVTVTDYHGETHGEVDMPQALAESCNNYFARTAVAVGAQNFTETAEAFGFGKAWWTQLPDPRMLPLHLVQSSLAPDPRHGIPEGELAHMGFGQSTVVVTPLQMAIIAAGVANDGTPLAPYLVAEVRNKGVVEQRFGSIPIGYPLSREAAATLAEMMRGVVTHGTGTGAQVPGLTVYGKTGTAQQTGGNDHAWFIGFAARERNGAVEKVAFAVLIERGGTGGRVAVPVARQLLMRWAAE